MVHQNAKAISVDTSNVLTAGYLSLEAAVSLGDLIICIDRGSFLWLFGSNSLFLSSSNAYHGRCSQYAS